MQDGSKIWLDEGQLVRKSNYTLHHYLKDHLGNVRLVFDEQGQTVQETEYYAFGYYLALMAGIINCSAFH
ncbi:hypothetical protein [Telluribacter humicola]|uniref:hypothetical protein n=1 Tax=Telluribacter humicola TaxID=1720261 RepID=UPI001A956DD7|nr:hypothetical protein [Telluribacter humicola]